MASTSNFIKFNYDGVDLSGACFELSADGGNSADAAGNIALGHDAMKNVKASSTTVVKRNIAIGFKAAQAVLAPGSGAPTISIDNIAIGDNAIYSVQGTNQTAGTRNIGIGTQSGGGVGQGHKNIFLGHFTGQNISTSEGVEGNIIIGDDAVSANSFKGDNNVVIGRLAGEDLTGNGTTDPDNNVIIGIGSLLT